MTGDARVHPLAAMLETMVRTLERELHPEDRSDVERLRRAKHDAPEETDAA